MASSSSSSPSAAAVSSLAWKYHVFLNFRGEDTRKTFVDHLYSALLQQGIYTYKDDETLPRGESIGPSLEMAIEESKIAIIIFSKNYADSSWCLDELAYIMKCKDKRGQIIMPIFYDVEPSTVRKQKQKYGEAFSKHELENKKKVEYWRKALVDASNLSGWETKHMANGHESKVIKEIVDTISHRLHPLFTSSSDENLVGIETRLQDLKSKLEFGSGGVRMIGIWGVGGGGKTTLASSVYNEISSMFDGCCFLENIREESNRYGLEKLEEKIISNVLKRNNTEVNKLGDRWSLKSRLHHLKVLIVLDDVDRLNHLKMLVGSPDWFGEGSRIIITTRDQHLLIAHKVNVIYNISLLNYGESIKLFRKHAPQGKRRMEDYELLSKDVVSYAGGLPLALTVLGCFLCDKNISEWRSTLARLKEIPETDILEKLKISYDGLKPVEQDLFLDIACFFRRRYKDESIMATLDACGFYPIIGIKVLIQKALITISDGMFDMHDLVQEMGHYIARAEHPKNPEKHSRIWMKEDVVKLFAMGATKELDMIQAIRFECNQYGPAEPLPQIVANMKNLRWVDWRGRHASPFPTNFPPRELCCLILDRYSQKQLWNGYKHLPNLKTMELYGLKNLITTPDFDGLPNLERFILHDSPHIEDIHPSIGRLKRLVFLSINFVPSLKVFPPITQLKTLETLLLLDCPNLQHLPLDNSGKEHGTEVKKPREDLFDVECRVEASCLPHKHILLRFFLRDLRKLDLSYCNVGDRDIGSVVWELPDLKELNLAGNKFSRLSFCLLRLPRLQHLNISYCKHLRELSDLPSTIAVVIADGCTSLESFGDISKCKWLWKVSLVGPNKLGVDILLHSMLQGNAIEDHFLSVGLQSSVIPKGFVGRLFRERTFTMRLPDDWYHDFCGFLICIVTRLKSPHVNIVIKQESDEDSRSNIWQEYSNEAPESELYFGQVKIYMGYVSFSHLRQTTLLNSSYNNISFSIQDMHDWGTYTGETCVGAELVSRKSKLVDETDCSEFWDKEDEDGLNTTFTVRQHDSKSSIDILWKPYYYGNIQKVVVKVDLDDNKEKRKALKAVSSISGVESLAMDMKDKKLTVIGEVDSVTIIEKLRKRWHAEILEVHNKLTVIGDGWMKR